jgi:hypothetical protein
MLTEKESFSTYFSKTINILMNQIFTLFLEVFLKIVLLFPFVSMLTVNLLEHHSLLKHIVLLSKPSPPSFVHDL